MAAAIAIAAAVQAAHIVVALYHLTRFGCRNHGIARRRATRAEKEKKKEEEREMGLAM
jgi:hypothetical protein